MKYLSLDIETTGLRRDDPNDMDEILSIGLVADDLETGYMGQPSAKAHIIIDVGGKTLSGNLVAFVMNSNLMSSILGLHKQVQKGSIDYDLAYTSNKVTFFTGKDFVLDLIEGFVDYHELREHPNQAITVAGKNVEGFDLRFLNNAFGLNSRIKVASRTIDPSILFMRPEDKKVPSLGTAKERAGLSSVVAHNALEDALDIVKLVRIGMSKQAETTTNTGEVLCMI